MHLILKLEEDKPRLLQTPAAILKIGSKNLILKNTGVCRKLLGKIPARSAPKKIPAEKFPAAKKSPRSKIPKNPHYIYKPKNPS